MTSITSEIYVHKLLMVCAMPIPEQVKALFALVFVNLRDLIEYVWKNINKTDAFHLIIPLDCLEQLLNDPIYRFPQVLHIDVIYDGINELRKYRRRFPLKYKKVNLCTLYDLLRRWETIETNKALVSSNPIDRSTIDAIISIIKDRIHLKQLTTFNNFSPFSKQCTLTSLYGLPAKNIIDFAPCLVCSSCKLINQQLYKLECEHQQCIVCMKIQKNCTTCFKAVSRDKIDENISYQQNSTGANQDLILGNLSSLDSDASITSLNGTCIWEVSNISDMKDNAVFDELRSIYSSWFYLFPYGYKISVMLFLNGDTKSRGTYMSLYFVLMRGSYDNDLCWPFQFKVTFTLLDHLSPNNNQTNFLWPDTKSIAFQRPSSEMNIPYGISKFVPLNVFEHNENHYVKNDRMFIKIEVDFLAERPTISLIGDVGELLNEKELVDTNYDNLPQLLCCSDA
ncbi:unnamed protein product [Rotaria sp. Silwood1]|nr:unnamed protein product [Rotaria sp. Silwood1]